MDVPTPNVTQRPTAETDCGRDAPTRPGGQSWHPVGVNDVPSTIGSHAAREAKAATTPDDAANGPDESARGELEALVPGWLTLPDVAERQGVEIQTARQQLKDRDILAVRRSERQVLCVPEPFVTTEGPRPELRGTFTVLADGGMSDVEILVWMFTPDQTLRGGSPMGALLAGHKTEVRRRAMESAF